MLKKRVITATILALVLIADTFLPMIGFAISMAIVVAAGAWEWSNLAGVKQTSYRLLYVLLMLLSLVAIFHLPAIVVLITAIIFWIFALAIIAFYPTATRYWQHPISRGLMGLFALSFMWFSFVLVHELPGGAWLILILWAMIALADIGAYFVGHAIGKVKLAPMVSPGKTREGAYGGILCAAIISFGAAFFYFQNLNQALLYAVIGILVAIASIVGDLFESMLKRFRGIKDSGRLLPGHGGVLDRIDGWTAAAPVYAFLLVMTF